MQDNYKLSIICIIVYETDMDFIEKPLDKTVYILYILIYTVYIQFTN